MENVEKQHAPARHSSAGGYLLAIIALIAGLGAVGIWSASDKSVMTNAPAAIPTTASDPVIMSVNGMPVHKSEFDIAASEIPEGSQGVLVTEAGKKAVAEDLIKMKVLEQEARKLGLDKDPKVATQLNVTESNILANAALEKLMASQPNLTPQQLYEQNQKLFETVTGKQILVLTQGGAGVAPNEGLPPAQAKAKADEIIARIRAGEPFDKVAAEESAKKGSPVRAAALPPVNRTKVPPEIEKTLFALQNGQVSDPVKAAYGYLIFQVTDHSVLPFAKVEPTLQQQGRQLQAKNLIDKIRSTAKVDYDANFFKNDLRPSAQ